MEQKKKKIFFYKSALCPRCMMARRILLGLQVDFPWLEIEEIDVATNPRRAWKDGIRLIPAIKGDAQSISGLFLNSEQIRNFIEKL